MRIFDNNPPPRWVPEDFAMACLAFWQAPHSGYFSTGRQDQLRIACPGSPFGMFPEPRGLAVRPLLAAVSLLGAAGGGLSAGKRHTMTFHGTMQ